MDRTQSQNPVTVRTRPRRRPESRRAQLAPQKAGNPAPLFIAGAAIFALLAVLAVADLIMLRGSRHGRERYDDLQVTVAPTVNLQSLPWSDQLPKAGADQFAVSPSGSLVVRIGSRLYDFADGAKLISGNENEIQSFAFVNGALAVITNSGHLGYVSDESVVDVGKVPQGTSRMSGSDNSDQLFFYGGASNYSLLSLADDGDPHLLASSPEMIEVVAGNRNRHVFSIGSSLFVQSDADKPVMLLDFPDAKIAGVAFNGDTIYCATNKGIYQLEGALAVPLVLGMGGQLRLTPDGMFVLNSENGRIYRLVFTNQQALAESHN
jgi:hypothetical protein